MRREGGRGGERELGEEDKRGNEEIGRKRRRSEGMRREEGK